ncbi:MAG: S8 family serine peptidase [Acidobacteriota bacterium]
MNKCALALLVWSSALLATGAAMGAVRPIAAPRAMTLPAPALHSVAPGFEGAATTDDGRIQVMVELVDPPAAVAYAEAMKNRKPSDKAAVKAAGSVSRVQGGKVRAAQDALAPELARVSGGRELYRVHNALNGIAMAVSADGIRALAGVKGVKRVLPILLDHPTNSTSVPFLGTPNVWANNLVPPLAGGGVLGEGIRVGIIDTGLDYLHADFGGTGLLADYQTESTNTTGFTTAGSFPTAKVVGGTDLAGDTYNGGNSPAPDPNPMDCNGHGSHVAGTAAGFGVTAAGATFAGTYDANTSTYSGLRIGPGTAPKALLYSIRVFGCTGGTGLTTLAIDWAMDPNGDSDLSDHLDVINMSLGSDFGTVINSSSVSSDNAALAGVVVVTSAGNAGDTFFVAGAPGVATRVIATAASVDSGQTAPSIKANAPVGIVGYYQAGTAAFGNAPPVPLGTTGNVVAALDPADGAGPLTTDGCSPITNGGAVAGNIALIDRGTCGFVVKTKNAQDAGAIGVIIANSAAGVFGGMAGVDPTVVIPAVMVTFADGNTFKANIATLNVTLFPGSDMVAGFSSRGPRQIQGSPLALKPDISAPGLNISSVQTGHTCLVAAGCTGVSDPSGFQAGNQALVISGTSMASPHVAGIMALLRQVKPDWSVEELKALAMNYAIHDMTLNPNAVPPTFGDSRIGAGRVDPATAALGNVIAMNAEEEGQVSIAFQPEVAGTVTRTKRVRVLNKGNTSQTFDLGISTIVDSPGASFSLPGGSSITIGPGGAAEFDVQMDADASTMQHTHDASLFLTQAIQANFGSQPRNFLAEESGYITFSQSSTLKFRLPVYMAERPASAMSAPPTIVTGGSPTGSTTIPLSGTGVCTGTLTAGPACTGTFPLDVESTVTPFELQVVSPLDPVNAFAHNDIHYVGVSYFPNADGGGPGATHDLLMFGVASWGDWSTPNDVAYDICIDNNNDGVYEKVLINTSPSIFVANASLNDNFVRVIRDTTTGGYSILGLGSPVNLLNPNVFDSALHLNNVMFMAASPSDLGLTSTLVKYKVVTCPATNAGCARTTIGDKCSPAPGTFFDQAVGPYQFDTAAPGLDFGGNFLADDLNGSSLPVSWNTANMTANGSLGALLLHHLNGSGNRAEVAVLEGTNHDDLSVALGYTPVAPNVGDNIVLTVTATNSGPNTATGVTVGVTLPAGLTYVSDDGLGTYDSGSGLWSIAALSTPTTLHITVTVNAPGPQEVQAIVGGFTPLDTNPANDTAKVTVNAPTQADLEVSISSSVPSALAQDSVTFTVTLTNNGPDTAFGVETTTTFVPTALITGSVASTGTFTSGTGKWNIASMASGASATLDITVTVPNSSDTLVASTSTISTTDPTGDPNTVNNSDSSTVFVGLGFYSLPPCRVADTRPSSAMTASEQRDFDMTVGGCGVPAGAIAVSYNITTVPTANGDLKVFAAGTSVPDSTAINFAAGKTRANNGVSKMSTAGSISVLNESIGTTDVIIDVNGYFN